MSDREILEGHPKSLFVSLLDGREKKDYVEVRASLYEESWSEQEDLLQVFPFRPWSFFLGSLQLLGGIAEV